MVISMANSIKRQQLWQIYHEFFIYIIKHKHDLPFTLSLTYKIHQIIQVRRLQSAGILLKCTFQTTVLHIYNAHMYDLFNQNYRPPYLYTNTNKEFMSAFKPVNQYQDTLYGIL